MHAVQTILLLLIAAGVAYVAYRLTYGEQGGEAPSGPTERQEPGHEAGQHPGSDRYNRQLAVYREVVKVLTRIAQDGHIEKEELLAFRSMTHESLFLFDREVAGYIDEIYQRGMKLAGTNKALQNTELSIGEERDAITVENAKQLIWLADQLSQLGKRFGKHLASGGPSGA